MTNTISGSAMDKQVGGSHYKKYTIQPMIYAMQNNLNHGQGTVIDYVTRYKDKGGRQDLEKAIHVLEMMIENEYGEELVRRETKTSKEESYGEGFGKQGLSSEGHTFTAISQDWGFNG